MKFKTPPFNWETALYILFILIALSTRFWGLDLRTMSYDESIHAYYSWQLAFGQGYVHNPITHGPFLFHANAIVYLLFGANDFTARILPALFSVVLVGLPFFLRRWLGRTGALVSSGLILISPSLLYYSRYIRNDIYIAVWTVLMLLAFFKYLEDRQDHWLYLGAVVLALSLCTKEVAFFHGFIFLTFILLAAPRVFPSLKSIKPRSLIISLTIMVVIFMVLYTSFFTNLSGLASGTLGAASHWLSRHPITLGNQPWYYYLFLLPFYEFLPLILALTGIGYFLVKLIRRQSISLFTCFLIYWWLMAWIIYSLAGEKMPWLMLHILLPTILLAGNFVEEYCRRERKMLLTAVILALGILTLRFSWMANYIIDDYSREFLAFAHSSSDVKLAIRRIEELSHLSGDGKRIKIAYDKDSAWPFEWYLREYPNRVYYGTSPNEEKLNAPVVIVGPKNEEKVKPFLGNRYHRFYYRLLCWPIKNYEELTPRKILDDLRNPAKRKSLWNIFYYRRYNIPPNSWPKVQAFAFYVRILTL